MDAFLLAVGWWNFVGSLMMIGFMNQRFGKLVLNQWTMIFKDEFVLDYWGKLWCFWAAGINIFFGYINIMAVGWAFPDLQWFLLYFDLVAYLVFISMTLWGHRVGRLGEGVYVVYFIFLGWISWASWIIYSAG